MMIDVDTIRAVVGPATLIGDDVAELIEAMGRPAANAVRVRGSAEVAELPFQTMPVAWHTQGRLVAEKVRPGSYVHFGAGQYYIQDAGSLLAIRLLDARAGERICDLCAAPGGKATAILETIGDAGWLLANEAIASRVGALQVNLARHGSTRFVLSRMDPHRLADFVANAFDGVLVDAPCSGQSLVGRGKQTTGAFREHTIRHCAARQTRILDAAARLVQPDGRLVYSTCTFSCAENEDQITAFLTRHSGWALEPDPAMQSWQSPVLPGCYRLWPHRHPTSGAFAARLRRSEDSDDVQPLTRARMRWRPARLPASLASLGDLGIPALWEAGVSLVGWAEVPDPTWLRVAAWGPEVAVRRQSTWIPAYGLARRSAPAWPGRATVVLDDLQAKDYLLGQTIRCSQSGWAVATWRQRALGWTKGDGTRAKNHLPKSARFNGNVRCG